MARRKRTRRPIRSERAAMAFEGVIVSSAILLFMAMALKTMVDTFAHDLHARGARLTAQGISGSKLTNKCAALRKAMFMPTLDCSKLSRLHALEFNELEDAAKSGTAGGGTGIFVMVEWEGAVGIARCAERAKC